MNNDNFFSNHFKSFILTIPFLLVSICGIAVSSPYQDMPDPAEHKSFFEERSDWEGSLTLAHIIVRSASKSEDILNDDWESEIKHLETEGMVSEYFPRAEINSSLYYSDTSDYDNLDDAFRSHLSINWNLINSWKIFFRKKYMERNAAYRKLVRSQAIRKSQAKAIAFYYNYWAAENYMNVVDSEKKLAEKNLSNTRFAFEKDLIPQKNVDLLERKLEEVSWAYDDAVLIHKQAEQKLVRFLFLPRKVRFASPPVIQLPQVPSLETVISKSLESSEALLLSQKQVKRASESINKAKYERWTIFNTSIYAGNSVPLHEYADLDDLENVFYGAELKWRLPVFDGGYYKRKQKKTVIAYEKALLENENLPIDIIEKVTDMWRELIKRRKKILLTQEKLEEEEAGFEVLKLKYDNGDIAEIDKEKAYLELKKLRGQLLLQNYEYIVTHANLDIFCGNDLNWINEKMQRRLTEKEKS